MELLLLLVVPPQLGLLEGFANGVISIANYLTRHAPNVDVKLLDLSLSSKSEVDAAVSSMTAQSRAKRLIVGITTTTATYQSSLLVAQAFRKRRRDSFIVLGGHHASAQTDIILESHPQLVDAIVRGEGELPLIKLLSEFPQLWAVPGLSYIDDNGTIRHNPPAPMLEQEALDTIGPTLNGGGLRSAPGKFSHVTYVSARGCPLSCAFCSVANQKIRAKSVAAVIEDIRYLVTKLGFRSIAIEDNFFAHSRLRTVELCSALETLRSSIEFTWDCQTRVESMARNDILGAMERAGCEAVYLGVEALTTGQLLYLAKTRNPDSYLRMLSESVVPDLMRSSVQCYINLQLAIPGETEEQRTEMLERLSGLGATAARRGRVITVFPQLHVVYPGTHHFHEAISSGRFGTHGRSIFEDFTHWEARQNPILTWLGEHFAHGVGGIPEGLLLSDKLRDGAFEVNPNAVFVVTSMLTAIDRMEGIRVFRYGNFLAKEVTCAPPQIPARTTFGLEAKC